MHDKAGLKLANDGYSRSIVASGLQQITLRNCGRCRLFYSAKVRVGDAVSVSARKATSITL